MRVSENNKPPEGQIELVSDVGVPVESMVVAVDRCPNRALYGNSESVERASAVQISQSLGQHLLVENRSIQFFEGLRRA